MEPRSGQYPASNGPALSEEGGPSDATAAGRPTLGNLPPLHLGRVLRPLTPEDDLLEEMLNP